MLLFRDIINLTKGRKMTAETEKKVLEEQQELAEMINIAVITLKTTAQATQTQIEKIRAEEISKTDDGNWEITLSYIDKDSQSAFSTIYSNADSSRLYKIFTIDPESKRAIAIKAKN